MPRLRSTLPSRRDQGERSRLWDSRVGAACSVASVAIQHEDSMTKIHDRIAASFNSQGLMATIGAKLALVSDGEVHIALPFSRDFLSSTVVHAGAVTSAVDTACGYAALTSPIRLRCRHSRVQDQLSAPALGDHFLAPEECRILQVPDGLHRRSPCVLRDRLPTRSSHSCDTTPTFVNDAVAPGNVRGRHGSTQCTTLFRCPVSC